jgi:dienelactone hydrolase
MMATAAYTDPPGLNARNCPDRNLLRLPKPDETKGDVDFRRDVRGWVAYLNAHGWDCFTGVRGNLPCPPRLGAKCKPVGGLEYQVWRRRQGGQCREVVIAFRGTDKNDLGDWVSNFRWLNRLVPKFDQYAQVQTHITDVVKNIRRDCPGSGTQFVSAGHSLGGGLAQQAAYADEEGGIRYVYAFDPSPVTGYFDLSDLVLEHSTAGLGVDRAYEQGEILALPRAIVENIFPPAPCNPRVRTVRFNLFSGLPVSQHSIAELTKRMRAVAHQRGANPKRAEERLQASTCKGGPLLPLPVSIQSPA